MQSVLAIIPFPLPQADTPVEGLSDGDLPEGPPFSLDAVPRTAEDPKLPTADTLPALTIPAFWPVQVPVPAGLAQADAMAQAVDDPVLSLQAPVPAKTDVSGAALVVPAPVPGPASPVVHAPGPSAGPTRPAAAEQGPARAEPARADGLIPAQVQPGSDAAVDPPGSGRPGRSTVGPDVAPRVLAPSGATGAAPATYKASNHTDRGALPDVRSATALPPGLSAPMGSNITVDTMPTPDAPPFISAPAQSAERAVPLPAPARPLAAPEMLELPESVPGADPSALPVQSSPNSDPSTAPAAPAAVAPVPPAAIEPALTNGAAAPDRAAARTAGFWERFFTALPASSDVDALPGPHPVDAPVVPGTTDGLIVAPSEEAKDRTGPKAAPDPGPDLRVGAGRTAPEPPAAPDQRAGAPDPFWLPDAARTISDGPPEVPAFGTVHTVAAGALALPGSTTAPVTLPAPQIAAQITAALVHDRAGVTELALAPEELGHVRLRLEPDPTNADRMVVMISVERPETLDLFRRHAGDLAEALRAAGYSGADIGFGQHGGNERPDQRHARTDAGPAPGPEPGTPPPAPSRRAAGASLDLRL